MAQKKDNQQANSKLETVRHSLSHIMAAAVLEMFPEAKLGIGPAIENGFYYDFDLPRTLIPEDLPILEEKMRKIIGKDSPFQRTEVPIDDASKEAKTKKETYKLELLEELKTQKTKTVSFYRTDDFVDLCKGPHVASTGKVGAFKLTKISGAYWRGDEKNKMLQRIYGVAFETEKELDEYLKNMEEAEKRDHRKLGKELDLFSFHSEAPGAAFWHPKGMIIWNELEKFGKSLRKKYGSEEIQTPVLAKNTLWQTSGHWDHYKDEMYHFKIEDEVYAIKPMDCPFNIKIYQERNRSYKNLPIRYTETGRVMRNEKSGQLNGLFRVRQLTQDDAHIFCTEEQVEKEIVTLIKMVKEYYKVFDIKPEFFFSTRPEDFMGEKKTWNKAEKNLENALKKEKVAYEVKEADGAFYGPKVDIDIKDALGRRWQLATIQLDFQLPQRFKLEYTGEDGSKKTPVMIHAAIFGSYERFIGILTEHFGGAFPLWLAPVQAIIIPISDKKHLNYSLKIAEELKENEFRVELDDRAESMGKKIREAELQKIPYMIIVGDKEMEAKKISVRSLKSGDLGQKDLQKFIEKIEEEINEKK